MVSRHFYPRPPRGGRPGLDIAVVLAFLFLSTPSARRATAVARSTASRSMYFYPRPPRGGRRGWMLHRGGLQTFLSTPSARRATGILHHSCTPFPISIHALREEGDLRRGWLQRTCRISIHALREEGDVQRSGNADGRHGISIHALREEGDTTEPDLTTISFDFYPRPPRGGRLSSKAIGSTIKLFLSTPSARRATWYCICPVGLADEFLSTPSARRATHLRFRQLFRGCISIHALREEGDQRRGGCLFQLHGFLSTPSARRATSQNCSR